MNKITNIKINRPSQNEMEKYIAVWNNFKNRKENKISKYYFQEIAIKKIFDHYWKNTISNVLIKVCCLNIFYSTKIFDIYHICKGIAKIGKKLETKLRNGDLGVIEEIANVSKKYSDKGRRNYSFATKFCCLHNKNKFPIFDRAV
ncbi:MAG: hypothetical protein MJ201_00990 [Mycoplasmoidaceae bacterium]|nr:hypothetical protein [Mycoplasmoidaceae bacterium]